jgi:hypothetical protein
LGKAFLCAIDYFKKLCYNNNVKKKIRKGVSEYMSVNENLAIQFVLSFIDTKTLLAAAMRGFEESSERDKENSDVCYKAIKVYL